MESNKHNDELIKRKLADVGVEPRKLKFATVHANYEKALTASSSKKWGLYLIFAGIGIAVVISAYLFLNHGAENALAENKSDNSKLAENISTSKQMENTSVNEEISITEGSNNNSNNNVKAETSEASTTETDNAKTKEEVALKENKTPSTTSSEKQETNKTKKENTLSVRKERSNNVSESIHTPEKSEKRSSDKKSNNSSIENSSKEGVTKTEESKKKETTNTTSTSGKKTSKENSGSKEQAKQNNASSEKKNEKILASTKVKSAETNSDQTNKGTDKNKDGVSSKAKEKEVNNLVLNSGTTGTKEGELNSFKLNTNKTQEGQNDPNIFNASKSSENGNNLEGQNLNTSKEEKGDVNNAATTNSMVSTNNKTVTAAEQINPATVVGSGSISARDKHQFLLSTEVIYSIIDYKVKANPNAAGQFYQGEPGFTQLYTSALSSNKYKLISGSASLSYVYKGGFGVNAGIGFFNVESTVNTQGFGSKKSSVVIDSLVHQLDSFMNWIVIDTVYKTITSSNYAVVNGDSVRNQDYLNNLRFITIPFKFSYNIRLGGKFSIEPQAGIQLAIPVKSYQLIATRAYEFEYKKTKDNLNPKNLYFDLGLKLGYKISHSAQLYIKQGYFFRNKSVYPGNYALDYSLRSIYTTFGISIRLK